MNSAGLPSSSTNYSIIEHNVGIDLSPTGTIRENDAAHISIVDLASPSPTPVHRAFIRQPLEVDLTCDEEDISILVSSTKSFATSLNSVFCRMLSTLPEEIMIFP